MDRVPGRLSKPGSLNRDPNRGGRLPGLACGTARTRESHKWVIEGGRPG